MEKWLNIPGYEGYYQVSNLGKVRSMDRYIHTEQKGKKYKYKIKGKIKDFYNHKGYLKVGLCKEGKQKCYNVHRLVLLAFIGDSALHVNHKDCNPLNNILENLEYCTRSENILHAYKNDRINKKGENHHINKLNNTKVKLIRLMLLMGETHKFIAKMFSVGADVISRIKNKKAWSHV